MTEPPDKNEDVLSIEFEKERSIRRTVRLLEAKKARIREDLQQLVSHLFLLVPVSKEIDDDAEMLIEAAHRLDDEIFTQLLVRVIQEIKETSA